MRPVKVGVVGCGFVGRGAHVPAFAEIETAELVSIADPDDARRSKVEKKFSLQSSYRDYSELVADPSVDLVVVAVPTPLHADVAMAAIEAGKHVLCEMPLAVTMDAAEQLIDAAKKQGVVLMPSLTFRFTPTFVRVKQMIEEGMIGSPVSLRYREFIPAADLASQWPAGSWMWDIAKSGGPLFTLAVWSIDLFRWLAGAEIDEVHATVNYTELETTRTHRNRSSASLRFADGTVGCLEYSGSVPRAAAECSLEVTGDSAKVLKTWDNDRVALLADAPTRTEWNVKQPGARMWGHLQQDEHLVEALRTGRRPDISAEDGRAAMAIAENVARASVPCSNE